MIMAAGLGTRMKPFTDKSAKPFLPLMGVPMVQFAIDALVLQGIKNIVINFHHQYEKSLSDLKMLEFKNVELKISDESKELLGGAGGIRNALPLLHEERFFILNSDLVSDVSLDSLEQRHIYNKRRYQTQLTLCVCQRKKPGERYREILINSEGQVTGLGDLSSTAPFYLGIAVIEKSALNYVKPSGFSDFLQEILLPKIKEGVVAAHVVKAEAFDIGSPALWLKTHVELIRQLELGRGLSSLIRKRIEKENCRVAEGVWISKKDIHRWRAKEWIGPAYWNTLLDETGKCPSSLGPNVVVYGGSWLESEIQTKNFISYNNESVQFNSTDLIF